MEQSLDVSIDTDSSPQSNILIDSSGRALLSDFGLSVILAELEGASYLTSSMGGTIRYAAPEIYAFQEDSTNVRVSTRSDVYSFGSVMYQVSVYCSSHVLQVIILLF